MRRHTHASNETPCLTGGCCSTTAKPVFAVVLFAAGFVKPKSEGQPIVALPGIDLRIAGDRYSVSGVCIGLCSSVQGK